MCVITMLDLYTVSSTLNQVQGTTIKPLVNLLHVTRSTKHKPSLNEQINNRMLDHLMAGVEDVAGHHGHHDLRERFQQFDNKCLKPVLLRDKSKRAGGTSILNVYQKLTERDALDLASHHGSAVLALGASAASLGSLQYGGSAASLSHMLATHTHKQGSLNISGGGKLMPPSPTVNMNPHLADVENNIITKSHSEVLGFVGDAMLMPRKRFSAHQRGMLDDSNADLAHHQVNLHLRKILKDPHHHHHHHRHHKNRDHNHHHEHSSGHSDSNSHSESHLHAGAGKLRKNVSFADDAADTESATKECDTSSMDVQLETDRLSPSSDRDSDEEGITFSVAVEATTPTNNEPPTVAESSLPWKRITGREVVVDSQSHSNLEGLGTPQVDMNGHLGADVEQGASDRKKASDTLDPITADYTSSTELINAHSPSPSPIPNGVLHSEEIEMSTLPPPWPNNGHDNAGYASSALSNKDSLSSALSRKSEDFSNHDDAGNVASIDISPPSEEGLPLPWRQDSDGEPSSHPIDLTSGFPSPTQQGEGQDDGGIPPPWRNNGSEDPVQAARSPTASHEMDSLRPQPSSHSLRVSEAESRHSDYVHMPHMIDLPRPPHDPDHRGLVDLDLELDPMDLDCHERVSQWLLKHEMDLSEPPYDLDLEGSHEADLKPSQGGNQETITLPDGSTKADVTHL